MSLSNALGYLTILPVPYKKHIPLLRSIHFFPLVGAGMGSVAVLFFVVAQRLLPEALACLLTVVLLEGLTGGIPLHGLAEMVQGRHTFPGHGFDTGFKLDQRGIIAVAVLLFAKVFALATLSLEWQTHVVFLFPIFGRCTQTLAFILSPHRLPDAYAKDSLIARRRVRAGFLCAGLLLLCFLFPWKLALPLLLAFVVIAVGGLKWLNARAQGLTLQTVSFLSEMSELSLVILVAIAGQTILR